MCNFRLGGWLLAGCLAFSCCVHVAWAEPSQTAEQRAETAIAVGKNKTADSIHDLTALLCDDDATVRAAAAWSMTQLGEAVIPALPQLIEGLTDSDARVRLGCATAIGPLGEEAATAESALIRATQDRSSDVRCAALIALRTIGIREIEPAIEVLGQAMQTGDPQVQVESIATASPLLKRCDPASRQALAASLFPALTSRSHDVRLAATVFAGEFGIDAAPAMTAIAKNVADSDDTIQSAAQQALSQFAAAVDRQWSRMEVEQRESLRRPCEVASKTLSGHESTSPEIANLAKRFQKLVTGIQLTAGEETTSQETDLLDSDDLLTADSSATAEPQRLNELTTAASAKSSWNSSWMWLSGIVVAIAAIWLIALGLKKDEMPIFIPAKPDELAMTSTDFAEHLHGHDDAPFAEVAPLAAVAAPAAPARPAKWESPKTEIVPLAVSQKKLPHADLDLLESQVLPAVLASVPGGELPDDVAGDATSPATSPTFTLPANIAARRDAVNQLADRGLDATSQLTRGMSDADAVVRWRSASAVGAVHAATLQPLLDAVGSTDVDVRRVAATSIRGFGQEVVPAFSNALKDQSAEVREAAATALGRIGRGAIEALVPLALSLRDSEPQVRAAAAMSLATLGPNAGRASGNLQQVLTDVSPAVRARAAFALGKIGPIAKGTVPDLIRLLTDVDPSVRRAAATALGGIGQDAKSAVPNLQQLLKDSDVGVRRSAVATLGLLAPNESAVALQAALTDTDSQVRTFAQSAIQKASKTNRTVPLNRAA